jgi:hypothetical protein
MYIDIKFLQTISYRLENFKKKSSNIWNCRCPICGDSARKNKARGYFFSSSGKNYLQYKCHNCAVSRRFDKFLKEFDPNQYGNYILEKYADNNNNIDKKNVESTLDFIPTFVEPKTEERLIDSIMDRLDNLPDTHEAIQYVRSRKIPAGAFRRLYFVGDIRDIGQLNAKYKASITSSESRLGIPFYNRDGKLTSISLRGMRGESLRYISVKIDEDAPTVFGMDQVDLNKDVLVVEGPLDSLFLPNCIACAGTAFNKIAEMNIPKEKVTIIFDNQPKNKEVCSLVHKYIEQGYKVVLWPDSVPGKDINEMIQHDLSSEDILEIIKSNTFSGLQARAKYAMWRKI